MHTHLYVHNKIRASKHYVQEHNIVHTQAYKRMNTKALMQTHVLIHMHIHTNYKRTQKNAFLR